MVEFWSSKSNVIGSNPIILIKNLMYKKGLIKLKILPGKANPSPPIGPILGQKGINIMSFCKDFNKITENIITDLKLSVIIYYYDDKSYKIFIKNPCFSDYLKKNLFLKNFSNLSLINVNYNDLKRIILNKINDFNVDNNYSIFKFTKSFLKSLNLNFKNDFKIKY